jgi:hypothetical protein
VTEQLVLPLDMEVTPGAALSSEATPQTPVLITEAEVVLGTAAAVPLRPAATGWQTRARLVAVAVRRMFAISANGERAKPRHHPKRLRYLHDARMEREMHRL